MTSLALLDAPPKLGGALRTPVTSGPVHFRPLFEAIGTVTVQPPSVEEFSGSRSFYYSQSALAAVRDAGHYALYSKVLEDLSEQVLSSDVIVWASSHVNETFGGALRRQPRQFVFSYGVPELSVWDFDSVDTPSQSVWLQEALHCAGLGQEDAALKHIAVGTTAIKTNEKELERLSDELDQLDLSKLPDIVLVSLLRNTFSFRSNVACWPKLLDQVEQILHERGQPARVLLRGLRS